MDRRLMPRIYLSLARADRTQMNLVDMIKNTARHLSPIWAGAGETRNRVIVVRLSTE